MEGSCEGGIQWRDSAMLNLISIWSNLDGPQVSFTIILYTFGEAWQMEFRSIIDNIQKIMVTKHKQIKIAI